MSKYTENNRRIWDEVVDFHVGSAFYDVAGFKAGRCGLSRIERAEVGDVAGKRLLHLLCHFGLDTLSWARLGAAVTGVDISEKAIDQARALAEDCGLPARFVRCEAFDSPRHIDEIFDIVFMSWGAICWISDFPALARVAADFLAPGGFFYLLDGHPIFTALDETWCPEAGPLRLADDYQSGPEPAAYDRGPDYADPSKRPRQGQSYEWAHGLGRIVTSLVDAGLQIEFLHEHDLIAWQGVQGLVSRDDHFWQMPDGPPHVPLSFSIKAVKD